MNIKPADLPPSAEFSTGLFEYLKKFPYQACITVGRVYTAEFKEFHNWCLDNLGKKHLDWHIIGNGKAGEYRLLFKDGKKYTWFCLKYSDIIND